MRKAPGPAGAERAGRASRGIPPRASGTVARRPTWTEGVAERRLANACLSGHSGRVVFGPYRTPGAPGRGLRRAVAEAAAGGASPLRTSYRSTLRILRIVCCPSRPAPARRGRPAVGARLARLPSRPGPPTRGPPRRSGRDGTDVAAVLSPRRLSPMQGNVGPCPAARGAVSAPPTGRAGQRHDHGPAAARPATRVRRGTRPAEKGDVNAHRAGPPGSGGPTADPWGQPPGTPRPARAERSRAQAMLPPARAPRLATGAEESAPTEPNVGHSTPGRPAARPSSPPPRYPRPARTENVADSEERSNSQVPHRRHSQCPRFAGTVPRASRSSKS